MLAAIGDVNQGMPYKTASRKHGVPRITLRNKHKGKSPLRARRGAASVFNPEQETSLVNWARFMSQAGFSVSREIFFNSVEKLGKELNVKFGKNSTPGRKWLKLFQTRHPELSFPKSQRLSAMRRNFTQESCYAWYTNIENYMRRTSALETMNNPTRVFSADEAAFFLNPKSGKAMVDRSCKNTYSKLRTHDGQNLTILMMANAWGQIAPPMIIYPYPKIPEIIAKSVPSDLVFGRSENGWTTQELILVYIKDIFLPWTKKKRIPLPVVLFIDGQATYISLQLSKLCKERGIKLVALHPNITVIPQPVDATIFQALRTIWINKVEEWKLKHNANRMQEKDFAVVFKEAMSEICETSVQNGFRNCGLFPWNPDMVIVNEEEPICLQSASTIKQQEELLFPKMEAETAASPREKDVSNIHIREQM